jgi:hypothetical protein
MRGDRRSATRETVGTIVGFRGGGGIKGGGVGLFLVKVGVPIFQPMRKKTLVIGAILCT